MTSDFCGNLTIGKQNRKHCHFVANKYRSSQDEDVKTKDITFRYSPAFTVPSMACPSSYVLQFVNHNRLLVENCSCPVNDSGAGRIRISEGEPR